MKREDIAKLFENATDEQISALLDINSQDIGKAKRGSEKLQADLDAANDALKKAQETIAGLEANKADVSALQQQIDQYKQAEAERAEAEKQAREEAELEARFSAVVGDKTFIHDMVREGVKRDFGAEMLPCAWMQKRGCENCVAPGEAQWRGPGATGHRPAFAPGSAAGARGAISAIFRGRSCPTSASKARSSARESRRRTSASSR